VFGYYDGAKLIYAGRTRGGFTPASRDQLFKRFAALASEKCPFANLPKQKAGAGAKAFHYEPRGMHEFIVESREPRTEHRLTRNMFDTRPSRADRPPMWCLKPS